MKRSTRSVSKEFQNLLASLIDSPAIPGQAKPALGQAQLELLQMMAEDKNISPRCRTAAQKLGLIPPPKSQPHVPHDILNERLAISFIWEYLSESEKCCIHVVQKDYQGNLIAYPQIHIGPHTKSVHCAPCNKVVAEKVYKKALRSSEYAIIINGYAARRLLVYVRVIGEEVSKVEIELYGTERRILLRGANNAQ